MRQWKGAEDWLCKSNIAIPEIIPLDTKDDDHFLPRGATISYDELSVNSSVWRPHSKPDGYEAASPLPDPVPNISP